MIGAILDDMVEEEINKAKKLYELYAAVFYREDSLGGLLEAYRKAIGRTQEVMAEVGVFAGCTACAREGAGSCCFQGVEEWYDHTLLFMNLILGIQIPESREVPGGCLFVGRKGCKLLARHSFCVNYICPRLKGVIQGPGMETLLSVSGNELLCGWETEQSIRKRLQESPHPSRLFTPLLEREDLAPPTRGFQ